MGVAIIGKQSRGEESVGSGYGLQVLPGDQHRGTSGKKGQKGPEPGSCLGLQLEGPLGNFHLE